MLLLPGVKLVLECSTLLRYQIFSKDVKIGEDREKRCKKCKLEKIICIVTPRTQTVKLTCKEIKNSRTYRI